MNTYTNQISDNRFLISNREIKNAAKTPTAKIIKDVF